MSKNWRHWDEESLDEFAVNEKMKTAKSKTTEQLPFEMSEEKWGTLFPTGFAARIVEVHKRYSFLVPEPTLGEIHTRDVHMATMARKFLLSEKKERNFVVVGDRVLCTPILAEQSGVQTDIPQCVIQHLSPRKSAITRIDPSDEKKTHTLASNIDQIMVVSSYVAPLIKWGLIDRYLALAEQQNIPALIVLNKKDLLADESSVFKQKCIERESILKKIGYEIFAIEARERCAETKRLGTFLRDKITILSGHSGVGKSTIVNSFQPELIQLTEPDDDIFYKGRHTTSFASFLKLKRGGFLIDTPGIRSFLIEQSEPKDLAPCFVEMRPYLFKCKFSKCRHLEDQGCAIKEAVIQGEISEQRYQSFVIIAKGESLRQGRAGTIDE